AADRIAKDPIILSLRLSHPEKSPSYANSLTNIRSFVRNRDAMRRIVRATTHDIRFPTSLTLAGSDAMNPDPDYSAAYVVLETDDGHEGHGLTFTIGRGTEVCVAAIEALAPVVVGATVDEITRDFAGFWRRLTHESQLRWLGPEKGVIHLATGALVNAVWDLYARLEGKPLWKLL